MKEFISKNQKAVYLSFGLFFTIIISLQSYLQENKTFANGLDYSRYNNYLIFKSSFIHLKENQNLYTIHDDKHFDLYKYTPTFAVFMAPFYYLPDAIGLFLWNAINILVLIYALSKVTFLSDKMKLLAHLFLLFEIISSTQNSQSNVLIAGLIILSYVFLTEQKIAKASLFILLAAFIKPFALVGFILFLFFPGKFKMFYWSVLWSVVLLLLPLIVVGWSDLIAQYENWKVMLDADHSASFGYSVMGWLQTWFSLEPNKIAVLIFGLVLLIVPLFFVRLYSVSRFQITMLSSVLIWVILFNHKSESPTFIIAMGGIAIWYFTQLPNRFNTVLIVIAFVFTGLIATDIFPRTVRKEWAEPYVIKVVPCILIWIKICWDLFQLWIAEKRNLKLS